MSDNKHKQVPLKAAASNDSQAFFLPELCDGKAVLFLVLVAELLAIVLTLMKQGFWAFDWQFFALLSLFSQWAFLSCAACLCYLRSRLHKLSMARGAAASYVLVVGLVAILQLSAQWLMSGMAILSDGEYFNSDGLITTIIITAVLAGIALRYFYLSQQLQLRQQAELQARIQALQSRIRPHFLFNSMNSIASLIAIDADAAERAVEDLSVLFRASLADMSTLVDWHEELELCRCYARIEQYRLGERLTIDWQLEEPPETLSIPLLSLQPLLENAIYHGIGHLPEGGRVVVKAYRQADAYIVSVSNPCLSEGREGGNRMALDNIRHRLAALYGDAAKLLIEKADNSYKVSVYYPFNIGNIGNKDRKK